MIKLDTRIQNQKNIIEDINNNIININNILKNIKSEIKLTKNFTKNIKKNEKNNAIIYILFNFILILIKNIII